MTYPSPTDPVDAFTRPDGTTEQHSDDHGRVIGLAENVMAHGAKLDGVTTDNTAFTAAATAAGVGGTIYVPTGVAILNNWVPPHQIHIQGAGAPRPGNLHGTTLKAAAAATTWVMSWSELFACSVSDLQIHGNGTSWPADPGTCGGVLVDATSSAQQHYFTNVNFYLCTTGVKLDDSGNNQVDKITFLDCRWDGCTTGLWMNSSDADLVLVAQGTFASCTTAIRATGGDLNLQTGSFGSCVNGITVDGASLASISLTNLHVEDTTNYDIDGNTHWPYGGVHVMGCTFGGTGTGASIRMGAGGVLTAVTTVFYENILATGGASLFTDIACHFQDSAVWVPTAGTEAQRFSVFSTNNNVRSTSAVAISAGTDGDQTTLLNIVAGGGNAASLKPGLVIRGDTNLYRDAADTLKTDDKLQVVGELELDAALNHDGSTIGFYGTTPIVKQTGVAVSTAGIHAALVNLGLISA